MEKADDGRTFFVVRLAEVWDREEFLWSLLEEEGLVEMGTRMGGVIMRVVGVEEVVELIVLYGNLFSLKITCSEMKLLLV